MRVRVSQMSGLAALAVVAALGAGCGENPTRPSSYAPYSQADLKAGTGTMAESGKTVTVNYTGWLYDGNQTDQKGAMFGTSTGSTGFQFVLGAGQVIKGWEQGVPGMLVGGVRRLVIPPSLAYGGDRNGPIPGNATLIFEIELLDVQ